MTEGNKEEKKERRKIGSQLKIIEQLERGEGRKGGRMEESGTTEKIKEKSS